MKKYSVVSIIAAVLVIVVLILWTLFQRGAKAKNDYAATMQVSGTTGASFNGEYVRDGKRIAISGVLPWSLTESNVTQFEIRKTKLEDMLTVDAHGGYSRISAHAAPGARGLRIEMDGGWSVETLK